ncbi:MAG TPA: hypothetical protein VE690_05485 [Rhodopila sp.]|nr:hypothetical protein [Rhodopila sp.]
MHLLQAKLDAAHVTIADLRVESALAAQKLEAEQQRATQAEASVSQLEHRLRARAEEITALTARLDTAQATIAQLWLDGASAA